MITVVSQFHHILYYCTLRLRMKRRKCSNGVNNWQYVEDAFQRGFGISLRKANHLNVNDLEITKL